MSLTPDSDPSEVQFPRPAPLPTSSFRQTAGYSIPPLQTLKADHSNMNVELLEVRGIP